MTERTPLVGGSANEPSRPARGRLAAYVAVGAVLAAGVIATSVTLAVVQDNPSSNEQKQDAGYKSAAVATDAGVCSDMGVELLKSGGGCA